MRSLIVPATTLATLLLVSPAQAANNDLTVKGTLSPVKTGTSVVLIANNGSSLTAKVNRKGRFTLKAPNPKVAAQVNPRKGQGATLHLLRDGKYAGPILLATKSATKGYSRLDPGLPKRVNLGRIAVKSAGYARLRQAPKQALLGRGVIALRKGVPLGAGTQGATGALRTGSSVRLTSIMPASVSSLGADADADGVPNVADVDMNGDQVIDAAQATTALQTSKGPLTGNEVLANRPQGVASFAKILDMDKTRAINSNRNPSVTWEVLTEYLRDQLAIETVVPGSAIRTALCGAPDSECAEAQAVAELTMDCSTLAYCKPDGPAVISASPGSGLDRQPLSVLLDSANRIVLPQDTHFVGPGTSILDTGFQLSFRPQVSSPGNLQFAGDAFQFTVFDAAGNALGQQTEVLTSSVATAPEWESIAGVAAPANMQAGPPMPIDLTKPLRLAFFRPQRLADNTGEQPRLVDRGGLQYSVYLMAFVNGRSDFYWCRASQVTSASPDLADLTGPPTPGREQMLFDTNLNPENGQPLAFDIDIAGCLNDPATGPGSPPAPGTNVTLEMESEDADGNRTRSQVFLQVP